MSFRSDEVHCLCTSAKEMDRRLGASAAAQLRLRLAQIEAADSLDDLAALPQVRCHNLESQERFRVDVTADVTVILESTSDEPGPASPEASMNSSQVTSVCVLAVTTNERGSDG